MKTATTAEHMLITRIGPLPRKRPTISRRTETLYEEIGRTPKSSMIDLVSSIANMSCHFRIV
jgi:hypothetical protein